MAQYQITVDGETLQQLFSGDQGMAKLVESVLNQVLERLEGGNLSVCVG